MKGKFGWVGKGIILAIVFLVSLYPSFEPDLGWHLKYGEYFWKNAQVQRENPYSIALSNYQWTNISWGYDVITYFVFQKAGFAGLTLLSATLICLSLWLLIQSTKSLSWVTVALSVAFLWTNTFVFAGGWRSQVVSALYFSALVFILTRFGQGRPRWLGITPFLFLIWANTHGTFILGLALFWLWAVIFSLVHKSLNRNLAIALLASTLITIIHPFVVNIYREALGFAPSQTLSLISEWWPPLSSTKTVGRFLTWQVISLIPTFLILRRVRKNLKYLPWIACFFILNLLSWQSARYTLALTIFTWPLFTVIKFNIEPNIDLLAKSLAWVIFVFFALSYFVQIILPGKFWAFTWKRYCDDDYIGCSDAAAQYILAHNLNNNQLFSTYIFGGWLIWNYPQIKPYVDGRTHFWEENGFSPFRYYSDLEKNVKSIDESEFETVFTSKTKAIYQELLGLVAQSKWTQVYDESSLAIFTRNSYQMLGR